jgi:hypothetical protein
MTASNTLGERARPSVSRAAIASAAPKVLIACVALAAFIDYASRSPRLITTDDPAELQVVTLAGGIPHGTSYPLYVWLARIFVTLPIGPVALRFNLFSAMCAALSLVAMAAFTARLGRPRPDTWAWGAAGAVGAALLALSHTFTEVATFTGMYTLHALLAFVAMALLARWSDTRRGRDLELALFVLGAMMANHIMTVALAPGVAVTVLWGVWKDRTQVVALLRGLLLAAGAFLFFDVFLFYLLWQKHLSFDHWAQIVACPRFFDLPPGAGSSFWYAWWYEITCRQFRFDVMSAPWAQRSAQLALILPRLASELSPLAVLFAAVGLARVVLKNARMGVMIVVVALTHIWLASGYTANTKTHIYLLTVDGLVACLAGVGLSLVIARLSAKVPERLRAVAVVGFVVVAAWGSEATRALYAESVTSEPAATRDVVLTNLGPRPDAHDQRQPIEIARRVAAALPQRALVFVDWPYMFTLQHVFRREEGGRRDMELHDPYPYGVGHREFPSDHIARILDPMRDRPVYFVLSSPPPAIAGFHLVPRTRDVSELVADAEGARP